MPLATVRSQASSRPRELFPHNNSLMILSSVGVCMKVADQMCSLAKEGPMFIFKGWVPAWTRLQPTYVHHLITVHDLHRLYIVLIRNRTILM